MIQPQSLVESQTTSDESHMITKRNTQSIRWDELRCERYIGPFNYVCTDCFNISLMIISFILVLSSYTFSHSNLNVGFILNGLKLSRTNSRGISNNLVMFPYDSRTFFS